MTDQPKKPAAPQRPPIQPPPRRQPPAPEVLPEVLKRRPAEPLNLAKHSLKGH